MVLCFCHVSQYWSGKVQSPLFVRISTPCLDEHCNHLCPLSGTSLPCTDSIHCSKVIRACISLIHTHCTVYNHLLANSTSHQPSQLSQTSFSMVWHLTFNLYSHWHWLYDTKDPSQAFTIHINDHPRTLYHVIDSMHTWHTFHTYQRWPYFWDFPPFQPE